MLAHPHLHFHDQFLSGAISMSSVSQCVIKTPLENGTGKQFQESSCRFRYPDWVQLKEADFWGRVSLFLQNKWYVEFITCVTVVYTSCHHLSSHFLSLSPHKCLWSSQSTLQLQDPLAMFQTQFRANSWKWSLELHLTRKFLFL